MHLLRSNLLHHLKTVAFPPSLCDLAVRDPHYVDARERDRPVGRWHAKLVPLVSAGGRPSHSHLVTRGHNVLAAEREVGENRVVEADDLFDSCEAGSLSGLQVMVDDSFVEQALRQPVGCVDIPQAHVVLSDSHQVDIHEASFTKALIAISTPGNRHSRHAVRMSMAPRRPPSPTAHSSVCRVVESTMRQRPPPAEIGGPRFPEAWRAQAEPHAGSPLRHRSWRAASSWAGRPAMFESGG